MNLNIQKLARTDNTLLITGRTGTGKSHLAREIHELSRRKSGKFVAINLATLSENIIESELFGHERGSFSGADCKRVGKLELANGGTVFLDEIGELPPRLQTKLLEALNSHTISPVGSNRELYLDVRIITATNKDLAAMVRENKFREDLFFRVNTFQIHLQDLAAEPWRVLPLAESFAQSSSRRQNRPYQGMDESFRSDVQSYSWPGNIRELKNAVDFAVALSPDGLLTSSCLPPLLKRGQAPGHKENPGYHFPSDYREAKSAFERTYLTEVLSRFEGKINLTAKRSGLSKVTLIDKIRRYDIDIPTIKYKAHQASREKLT
jgi:two-component system response regulator HydG